MERIHYIHEEFDAPALIEEYIEGREIYAAVLGNESPEVLPLIELDLSQLPEGTPKIAGKEVKWEKDTEDYHVTKSAPAEDLDEDTAKRLSDTALAAYQALKLRDYGRIDMRLTPKGEIYVIEANPNPWLSSGAEFSMAAKKAGRSYTQLIGEIVDLARVRYAGYLAAPGIESAPAEGAIMKKPSGRCCRAARRGRRPRLVDVAGVKSPTP